jgi:hypothetical protein
MMVPHASGLGVSQVVGAVLGAIVCSLLVAVALHLRQALGGAVLVSLDRLAPSSFM